MDLSFLIEIAAIGLGCAGGFGLGIVAMAFIYIITGRPKWNHWRKSFRPFLWYLGLDWPEIKRTWKRAFMIYYARGLPDAQQSEPPPESPDDVAPDASGNVSPVA